jgi:NAD(P)-dependent dehydrogenase (short-subunit alcohol dehydrogenase family)
VNMSSGMGALSEMEGGYAAYRISKVALNAVTRILAAELRGAVAVNSMAGSEPTSAAPTPSATFRKAQTPPSGSRWTPRRI